MKKEENAKLAKAMIDFHNLEAGASLQSTDAQPEPTEDEIWNEVYQLFDGWGNKSGSVLKQKLLEKYKVSRRDAQPVKGDDVKSKEEIWAKWQWEPSHTPRELNAMEEYANQFAAPQAVKWVQAKERLPELPPPYYEDGCKLTPVTNTAIVYDGENVFTESYDKDGFSNKYITHWMYMPLPPNENNPSKEWLEGSTDKNQTK